jgi:dihydrofolate reductase
MGKILVHEFMSLDGVIDTPTWTADYHWTDRMTDVVGGVTDRCTSILLGRTTYDMFSQAWPEQTVEDDPGAPFFNDTTKYVVSTTLTDPSWRNTEVLDGYDARRIAQLKSDVDGDIYVSGSVTLVRALLADALVDELHVLLYPVTRAEGPRLFTTDAAPASFEFAATEHFDNGVVYLRIHPRP